MSNLVAIANERFTDTYTTDLGHELTSSMATRRAALTQRLL